LTPRQPCASRDADACVERAADPLNSGRIDAKPCSDPAHALCASRLVQSLTDSFLQRRGYRRPTKTLPLAPGPRKPGADAFLNHGALELGKYAHHLKHRLACRRLTSSPSELSCCVRSSPVSKWLRHPRCQKQPFQDSSCRSSVERRIRAAATFSSRCASDDVPGMGTITGEWASSQAIATCTGVAPRRRATRPSAPPPAASSPAARGCQGRKASPPFSHSASTSLDERSEKL